MGDFVIVKNSRNMSPAADAFILLSTVGPVETTPVGVFKIAVAREFGVTQTSFVLARVEPDGRLTEIMALGDSLKKAGITGGTLIAVFGGGAEGATNVALRRGRCGTSFAHCCNDSQTPLSLARSPMPPISMLFFPLLQARRSRRPRRAAAAARLLRRAAALLVRFCFC
jgi:hypothetical protein